MKSTMFMAGFCLLAPIASVESSAQATQTVTKYVTVNGDVVRYEPGRVIVVRGADNKEVVYTLTPSLVVPADVKVGGRVTLYTEPGPNGGTQLVSRVTTTSVSPEGNVTRTTEDTRNLPSGGTSRTTTTSTTTGNVVRYEPGRTIVVRGTDNKEVVYALTPSIVVPADVKVGGKVTLYTEPGRNGGTQVVSRVTTTSITPEGNIARTTEDTRTLPSGATSKTTTTTVSGKVMSYEAGRTVTITRADGTKATYVLNDKTSVPSDLVVGKTIYIQPLTTAPAGQLVAQTVTYGTTPEGNLTRTTEETRTSASGEMTKTTTTTVSGKVEAYQAGKTLTITRADGTRVTYVINDRSKVPADLMIGKTISIVPITTTTGDPLIQTVTYVTVKPQQ